MLNKIFKKGFLINILNFCLVIIIIFSLGVKISSAITTDPTLLYPNLDKVNLIGTEGDEINVRENFLPNIMILIFKIMTGTIMVVLLVSGIMMITSFGDSEQREKAKKMIYYGALGIAVVALAYAIVKGITSLQFNQT